MNAKHTIEDLIEMVSELQKKVQVLESENAILKIRVSELERENDELRAENDKLRAENEELRAKISGGDGNKGSKTPKWVKKNTPENPKSERKKRDGAYFRKREEPTRIVEHAHDTCPDCGRPLCGGTLHHSRQVIEIPPISVEIVEHRYISRHCGVCRKNYVPKVDLSDEVIGTHRIGIRLMSLVSYLTITARVPKRTICKILKSLYNLEIGYGEINKILTAVANRCKGEADKILFAVRGSPYIHADETGWRENGKSGYIWSLSTPELRYFNWDRSRGSKVAKYLIGSAYRGVVVSDFYCGYSPLLCRHQRCWVHFLRDLHKLVEDHPNDAGVQAWADKIRRVYDASKAAAGKMVKNRIKLRLKFEEALVSLAEPYIKTKFPQRVLSKRIVRFASEMFVFVEYPMIPSENNAAERAVRPAVIARKVCGGSRSSNGTKTKMILMSLFGTWSAQGLDGIESCHSILAGKSVIFPKSL